MSLNEYWQKVKQYGKNLSREDFLVSSIIVLVAFSSFGLGRLSRIEESRSPVKITTPTQIKSSAEVAAVTEAIKKEQGGGGVESLKAPTPGGQVVASKNGTKYHFPWCAGAKQISEKNKVWFDSPEAARAKGYTPASNCKGLK